MQHYLLVDIALAAHTLYPWEVVVKERIVVLVAVTRPVVIFIRVHWAVEEVGLNVLHRHDIWGVGHLQYKMLLLQLVLVNPYCFAAVPFIAEGIISSSLYFQLAGSTIARHSRASYTSFSRIPWFGVHQLVSDQTSSVPVYASYVDVADIIVILLLLFGGFFHDRRV